MLSRIDPDLLLPGRVLVLAPHMDDELLGCGATLAQLTDLKRVHVAYVTDGAASSSPPPAFAAAARAELPGVRTEEARAAMEVLGVPAANLWFLDLPDGELGREGIPLFERLRELIVALEPDHLFVPFRFDRHPDHLAVNRAARRIVREAQTPIEVLEYFVYSRTRLLKRGDLRAYLRPGIVAAVEPRRAGLLKRRALECYRTQVACYFPWQWRPILTATLLEQNCAEPEIFVRTGRADEDRELFDVPLWLVRTVHAVEPRLKGWKDIAAARLRRRSMRGARRIA
jgi:LmbE family N-acetylglucosaminyl deacetylase